MRALSPDKLKGRRTVTNEMLPRDKGPSDLRAAAVRQGGAYAQGGVRGARGRARCAGHSEGGGYSCVASTAHERQTFLFSAIAMQAEEPQGFLAPHLFAGEPR